MKAQTTVMITHTTAMIAHTTAMIAHTTAYATPVVEYRLKRFVDRYTNNSIKHNDARDEITSQTKLSQDAGLTFVKHVKPVTMCTVTSVLMRSV